ncbi:MAG: RagB/SusD family nutrient uptake outer membrane protein [Sphingobacteriaceae bacterium]|nr:RagB/SusD family nutrient uptake outer membrane protein [Sphingobacteriaceae bacterium]
MKKHIISLLFFVVCAGQFSCKKFLNVTPLDKLSGVNFWQSRADVEAFSTSLYAIMRSKLTSTAFIPATGELRSGQILPTIINNSNSGGEKNIRLVYNQFAVNNLQRNASGVLDVTKPWNPATGSNLVFNFTSITKWTEFYSAIQGANIMFDRVTKGVPGLSEQEKRQYLAEAAFIRCFAYFTMVRVFGDVVYYIDPYERTPLPRENFVSVINKCIADLKSHKDNLPLIYSDPALKTIRATRGAALSLLMNMNMWNAGFDKANAITYWQETETLGDELIKADIYSLVPIEEFERVMRGRSEETIFEFGQSINYAPNPLPTNFFRAFFGEMMLRTPNKGANGDNNSSHAYFRADYLTSLYAGGPDKRRDLWFDSFMLSESGNFQLLKFQGIINSSVTNNPNAIPEWSLVMSRLAEVILLRAEALANLGTEGTAISMLNMVRNRAGAPDYSGPGGEHLKDEIFIERSKELMGEGHLYFDLVRTGRIMDGNWVPNPLSADQFERGAWTWPIDVNALYNNPFMQLNSYWQ